MSELRQTTGYIFVILFCLLTLQPAFAQNIDLGDLNVSRSRLPSWGSTRAGVQGGVPDSSTWPVHQTLTPGWSAAQLQSAIDAAHNACNSNSACPNGNIPGYVVQLPAETRNIANGSPVKLRSNVVVRGQGINQTRLRVNSVNTGNLDCEGGPGHGGRISNTFFVMCGQFDAFDNVDLTWTGGGPNAGSTQFTVNTSDSDYSASEFAPGKDVIISYNTHNPEALFYRHRPSNNVNATDWALQFMATITNFQAPVFTVDRPLRLDWSQNKPNGISCSDGACYQVRAFNAITNAGIEDLYVEGKHLGPIGGEPPNSAHPDARSTLISIRAAKNVWVKDVQASWSVSSPISLNTATNVSVVNSVLGPTLWSRCLNNSLFEKCTRANAGDYLMSVTQGLSDSVISNNVFLEHPIGIRFRGAANGNVISHNYHNATLSDERPHGSKSGVSHGLVFVHGWYPHQNLIESNDSNVVLAMVADCIWGENGPNTFFRNRASADGDPSGADYDGIDERGWFKWENQSVDCGNGSVLLGNNAYAYSDSTGGRYFSGGRNPATNGGIQKNLWFEYNLARDAVANVAGRGFNVPDNDSVGLDCGAGTGSCVRTNDHTYERNFEGAKAPSSWSSVQVPNSLYFESVADWERHTGDIWCAEACPWNSQNGIGAFGDDSTSAYCKLPAQIRHEKQPCTKDGSVDTVAPGSPGNLQIG